MTSIGRVTMHDRALVLLGMVALVSATAVAPVRGAATAPELTLPRALALLPDTPDLRAGGVWYADYALAERVYGVTGVHTMTDPHIGRFFASIIALRPGPETGVSGLALGRWHQVYGYDLFDITSEIYSTGAGTPSHPIGVDTGHLDLAYIAHVLATSGYTRTMIGSDRLFIQAPVPGWSAPSRNVNAVALTGERLVAGAWPEDVITATRRMRRGTGVLGQDAGYRALAATLGAVQGAYLAANVPPSPYDSSPFTLPPGGHRGARLHRFDLYATAYQEPSPGRRYMEIALGYRLRRDALADAPTLRARLGRESLPIYGAAWAQLTAASSVSVRGAVLLIRLHLRPGAPSTLWQDAVIEGDLSILSR